MKVQNLWMISASELPDYQTVVGSSAPSLHSISVEDYFSMKGSLEHTLSLMTLQNENCSQMQDETPEALDTFYTIPNLATFFPPNFKKPGTF